jgi:uncharacterized low-complexity protein
MSKKTTSKVLAGAIGATFIGSLTAMPVANAAENPFAAKPLTSGYQVADAHMKEGSCGGDKKGKKDGSCGGDKKGKKDGSCGGKKADDKKGKKDGSCGEAKCGGKK